MIIPRDHIIHSTNPYVRKCCGCIHLRIGNTFSCLIWAGLSLYFAILSFQTKSPFFSYTSVPTALYIFGTINLVLFGVCLGTLFCLFLRSENGVRAAAYIIGINVFILLVDVFINTILFIVQKDTYVEWCITAASSPLNSQLLSANQGEQQQFNFAIKDFYNCNRTWEDELKFTILCAALIIVLYSYWTFCLFSYAIKLQVNTRAAMLKYYQQGMLPQVPMMMPHVNNGDIIL